VDDDWGVNWLFEEVSFNVGLAGVIGRRESDFW